MVELLGTRVPPAFDSFVLVDDSGTLLAQVITPLSENIFCVIAGCFKSINTLEYGVDSSAYHLLMHSFVSKRKYFFSA